MSRLRLGVLALQGDFAAHSRAFGAVEVRASEEIDRLDRLILPGGESTAMLKLLEGSGIEEAVHRLLSRGGSVLGTCAGAILLANEVVNPSQKSWGLIDITIERNAYGRQVDSFESPLGPFIRAPRINRVGHGVEVLEKLEGWPVLVRHGRVTVATYHPELAEKPVLPLA